MRVEEVAAALGKSPQAVRVLLQNGFLPFGTAAKIPNKKNYMYIIYPEKFREYCGESVKE